MLLKCYVMLLSLVNCWIVVSAFPSATSQRANERPTFLASQEDCFIEDSEKIYRGQPELIQYVFMSMLEFKNDLGQRARCSGVLISNRHVLTSAHCVTKPGNWTLTHVRLGEYNTETELDCFEYTPYEKDCTEGVIAPVESVTVHEDYDAKDPVQYNDIALVKLAQEVKYTTFLRPICVATTTQEQEAMKKYTVPKKMYEMIGWNRTANHLIKRKKIAIVKEQTECQAKYNRKLDENQLCCESHKSDYPEDLKSPVLIGYMTTTNGGASWYLGGLSTYPANPENGALRIYTDTSGYAYWIIDKVQQSLQKPRLQKQELY